MARFLSDIILDTSAPSLLSVSAFVALVTWSSVVSSALVSASASSLTASVVASAAIVVVESSAISLIVVSFVRPVSSSSSPRSGSCLTASFSSRGISRFLSSASWACG